MSSVIINNIKGIEKLSYLELGIFDNSNFNKIKCKEKFSVDLNGQAMFTGTTDEYFHQLPKNKMFDIVFIDANHDYEYVLRDFNNAVEHTSKWILIHDMIPPTRKYIDSKYCSDSFKFLYFLLSNTKFKVYPMNNNFGLTFIEMPASKVFPSDDFKNLTYYEFVDYINERHLYSDNEIIEILRGTNV